MNLKDIQELIEILKDTDISELELERSGVRIRLRKHDRHAAAVVVEQAANPVPAQPPAPQAQPATPSPPPQPAGEAPVPEEGVVVVTSPIVGTFYRRPSPETAVYVEVGDVVKKGQILCLIEAMKLMNEIEAEVSGKITAVLVEDAHPVEFGQPLFHIELV